MRGSVELRRYSQSGQEITVHRSVAGETFAQASIFTTKFHCTAVATEQCEVVELQRGEILRKFRTEPAFAQFLAQKFAQDVQFYRRRLEIANMKNAKERVYFAICEGMMTGSIIQFSREVSLTHEVTYRALASLVRDGKLMKIGRGKYQLAHSNNIGWPRKI